MRSTPLGMESVAPEDCGVKPIPSDLTEAMNGPGPERLRQLISEYQLKRHLTADWVTLNIERLARILEILDKP